MKPKKAKKFQWDKISEKERKLVLSAFEVFFEQAGLGKEELQCLAFDRIASRDAVGHFANRIRYKIEDSNVLNIIRKVLYGQDDELWKQLNK